MRLAIDNLAIKRGRRLLFHKLSLTLKAPLLLHVKGANGCGKTSFLRAIAGLCPPFRGEVRLQQEKEQDDAQQQEQNQEQQQAQQPKAPFTSSARQSFMHYLSSKDNMKGALSLWQNLQFWQDFYQAIGKYHSPAQYHKIAKAPQSLSELLARFGLLNLAPLAFHLLSTGQKRRANLLRLLLHERPIWLLDEPLLGLDSQAALLFSEMIEEQLQKNAIIIIASHQPLPRFFAPGLAKGNSFKEQDLYLEDFAP